MLFYLRGSSSGGIDFLTMAIKKKHPSFSLGKITLMIDLAVILLGWPVFGDVDAVLYGLISTFVSVVVIDKFFTGSGQEHLRSLLRLTGERRQKRSGKMQTGA